MQDLDGVEPGRHGIVEEVLHALSGELDTVEILHGKGTGALRTALHDMLADRPDIVNHWTAPIEEGGAGVTKVDLG